MLVVRKILERINLVKEKCNRNRKGCYVRQWQDMQNVIQCTPSSQSAPFTSFLLHEIYEYSSCLYFCVVILAKFKIL